MIRIQDAFGRWPKWLKVIFTVSAYLFMFAVFFLINIYVTQRIALYIISISENPLATHATPLFIRLGSNPWIRNLSEYLVILAILHVITKTIREGRSWRTISLSIFYGLVILLFIFVFISSEGQAFNLAAQAFTSPNNPTQPTADNSVNSNFVVYLTAITGLITAITGLYAQFVSATKIRAELELQRQQLELERNKTLHKKKKTSTAKK